MTATLSWDQQEVRLVSRPSCCTELTGTLELYLPPVSATCPLPYSGYRLIKTEGWVCHHWRQSKYVYFCYTLLCTINICRKEYYLGFYIFTIPKSKIMLLQPLLSAKSSLLNFVFHHQKFMKLNANVQLTLVMHFAPSCIIKVASLFSEWNSYCYYFSFPRDIQRRHLI